MSETVARGTAGPNAVPLGIVAAGAAVWWLCRTEPALLPPWAPWEFSWPEFLCIAFPVWWYVRGLSLTPPELAPARWRRWFFATGAGLIYVVLQTRFEYLAQHMFFVNRAQHMVLHHIGPFLVALAWPGETIGRGMPPALLRLVRRRVVRRAIGVVQQPVLAGALFVGLVWLWLIPAVHFRAMTDPVLYAVMNWSMVLDGLLFWCLVMDPRGSPPARLSRPVRILVAFGVQVPQIIVGAFISVAGHDLYPYYRLCGRAFASIGADLDQQIGGFIVWFPGGMMSAIAVLLLFRAIAREEDRAQRAAHPELFPEDGDRDQTQWAGTQDQPPGTRAQAPAIQPLPWPAAGT